MTQEQSPTTRRRVLQSGVVAGIGIAAIPGIVGAQGKGNGSGRGGGSVEIEWARNLNGISGNGTDVAANAAIGFFPTRKLIPAYTFDIERLSSGDVLSVSLESKQVPDVRGAIFDIYDWIGRLARNSPRPSGTIQVWTGSEFVSVDYSLEGDFSIFEGGTSYDEYRVTLYRGRSEVDSTSQHVVPIGHPLDFHDGIVDNGQTFRFSFNASGLPGDAQLHAVIDPGPSPIFVPTLYHESGRYFGEIDADTLVNGDHLVRMTVTDSSTSFRIISLAGNFEI